MAKKTGVVLLNMGGPEKPEDVAPFLFNLFSDREIIRLGPRFLQKVIAWFIARKRAPKSLVTYNKIGGGSPLIRLTQEQAAALEELLSIEGDYKVVCAMRYWYPTAKEALQTLKEENITDIIALPLYPHFSCATSGSSLKDLKKAIAKSKHDFALEEIEGWPESPKYIQAFSDNILSALDEFGDENVEIVYSAHSLPTSFIDEGDPYLDQLKVTISKIEEITGKSGKLCFQSRSGPVEWLSPSTPDMLKQLSTEGCKNVLMVPISFVSDHVETLYEINMLYRDLAKEMGMTCRPCESLNSNPLFIEALKELVLEKAKQ